MQCGHALIESLSIMSWCVHVWNSKERQWGSPSETCLTAVVTDRRLGIPLEVSPQCCIRSVERQIRFTVALKDAAQLWCPSNWNSLTASKSAGEEESAGNALTGKRRSLKVQLSVMFQLVFSVLSKPVFGMVRWVWMTNSWTCVTNLGNGPNIKPTRKAGSTSCAAHMQKYI